MQAFVDNVVNFVQFRENPIKIIQIELMREGKVRLYYVHNWKFPIKLLTQP